MTIGVGKLPKVTFFFTGITIEIQAKKLSKNISIFTQYAWVKTIYSGRDPPKSPFPRGTQE